MRYQVVGKNHNVFGKKFGEHFERNLSDAQERNLIGGGFIVRAPIAPKKRERLPVVIPAPVVKANEPDTSIDDASTNPPEGTESS